MANSTIGPQNMYKSKSSPATSVGALVRQVLGHLFSRPFATIEIGNYGYNFSNVTVCDYYRYRFLKREV